MQSYRQTGIRKIVAYSLEFTHPADAALPAARRGFH